MPTHRLPGSWIRRATTLIALFLSFGFALGKAAADEDLPEHALVRFGSNAFSHGSYITRLALAPEASRIITIGGDGEVRIWKDNGELLQAIPRGPELANLSFSMDGRWRLGTERVELSPTDGRGDGAVQLFRAPSGKLIETFEGHRGAVTSLAWSGDGERLISGSADSTAIVWKSAFLQLQ